MQARGHVRGLLSLPLAIVLILCQTAFSADLTTPDIHGLAIQKASLASGPGSIEYERSTYLWSSGQEEEKAFGLTLDRFKQLPLTGDGATPESIKKALVALFADSKKSSYAKGVFRFKNGKYYSSLAFDWKETFGLIDVDGSLELRQMELDRKDPVKVMLPIKDQYSWDGAQGQRLRHRLSGAIQLDIYDKQQYLSCQRLRDFDATLSEEFPRLFDRTHVLPDQELSFSQTDKGQYKVLLTAPTGVGEYAINLDLQCALTDVALVKQQGKLKEAEVYRFYLKTETGVFVPQAILQMEARYTENGTFENCAATVLLASSWQFLPFPDGELKIEIPPGTIVNDRVAGTRYTFPK